jgi:uncharacterized protein YecE (DUF72 family)
MVEAWYPPEARTAEARLRYYARRFDTVEADAPFYGIPDPKVAENWAGRTPDGFRFHVKAFGLMTQHSVEERMLHPALRECRFEVSDRGRVHHPSSRMVDRSFELFGEFIAPLRTADKLGGVLMQFPLHFSALDKHQRDENLGYIQHAHERLEGVRMLVEFRHPSWVADENLMPTLAFLADREIAFVSVDAPQFPDRSTMPPVTAVTAPWAYVRLHGRNRDTYFGRNVSAADRFDYLYTSEELQEWAPRVRELASDAETTWVMFNNCKHDYAPRNAREMAEILADLVEPGVPGAASPDGAQLDLGI